MDKNQIRLQLEELQRDYVKTKRKLERSEKAARVKAHVKQKLREQADANQSFERLGNEPSTNRSNEDCGAKKSSRSRNRSVSFKLDNTSNPKPKVESSQPLLQNLVKNDIVQYSVIHEDEKEIPANNNAGRDSSTRTLEIFDGNAIGVDGNITIGDEDNCNKLCGHDLSLTGEKSLFSDTDHGDSSSNGSNSVHETRTEINEDKCLNLNDVQSIVSDLSFEDCSFTESHGDVHGENRTQVKISSNLEKEEKASRVVDVSDKSTQDVQSQGSVHEGRREKNRSNELQNGCEDTALNLEKGDTSNNTASNGSMEWTQMDIGDDIMDSLHVCEEARPMLTHLTHCKTVQVGVGSLAPVLFIHSCTVSWQGELCEAVICCTQDRVKLWYYSQSETEVWCQCGVQEWTCGQNEEIKMTSVLNEDHSANVVLLLCGTFIKCSVCLLLFTDHIQQVPLYKLDRNGSPLTCVVNPRTVIVTTVTTTCSELQRLVLMEDYGGVDNMCQLQSASDKLINVTPVNDLECALVGISHESVYIWNWEIGHLLTSVHLCSSSVVNIARLGGATYEAGLLFLVLNTADAVHLVAVNPNMQKSLAVQQYCVDNNERIASVLQHAGYIMAVTEEGTIMMWDVVSKQLTGKSNGLFTSAMWHPTKPVLMCGTKDGLVHVYVKGTC